MPAYDLAVLTVDYNARTIHFHGMDGHSPALTIADVQRELDTPHADGVRVAPLVYWHDNGQLCAHDAGSFQDFVNEQSDDDDDDTPDEPPTFL